MEQGKESSFEGRNYRNDYRHKTKIKQSAKGSVYISEITVASDDPDGLPELTVKQLTDTYRTLAKNHINRISPFETGYEPTD